MKRGFGDQDRGNVPKAMADRRIVSGIDAVASLRNRHACLPESGRVRVLSGGEGVQHGFAGAGGVAEQAGRGTGGGIVVVSYVFGNGENLVGHGDCDYSDGVESVDRRSLEFVFCQIVTGHRGADQFIEIQKITSWPEEAATRAKQQRWASCVDGAFMGSVFPLKQAVLVVDVHDLVDHAATPAAQASPCFLSRCFYPSLSR